MALEQSFHVADGDVLAASHDVELALRQFASSEMKKRKHRHPKNTPVVRQLESAILKAVKVVPGCEDFAGVVVQSITSNSHSEPNWEVRGVKFGTADRTIAGAAVAAIVTRLQQEFRLS